MPPEPWFRLQAGIKQANPTTAIHTFQGLRPLVLRTSVVVRAMPPSVTDE
jgi:hypothetical protein